jgi:hypothetical protein
VTDQDGHRREPDVWGSPPAAEQATPPGPTPAPPSPSAWTPPADSVPPVAPGDVGWPPADGSAAVAPAPRRPKAAILGGIGVVAAVAAAIAVKVLPFFAAGVIGSALSGVFGGPFERLPSDVRSGYEQRLEAAIGDRLEGLSDAEAGTRIEQMLFAGLTRLPDDRIVRHLDLQVRALRVTSEATCAAFGRQSLGGQAINDDTSNDLIASLDDAALAEWIGINVEAIEAESRGTPAQRFVTDAEVANVFDSIVGGLTPGQLNTISVVSTGGTATDTDVCSAIRALYDETQDLDPVGKAAMARYDIQP